jgi:hypothetical protein
MNDPDGYLGAVFDGQYVYFVPDYNGTAEHGEVLRYNTTTDFASASSWSAYDAGTNGVGSDPDGYGHIIFREGKTELQNNRIKGKIRKRMRLLWRPFD